MTTPDIIDLLEPRTKQIDPSKYKDKKGKQGIEDPALLKEYILNIYKTMMLRGIRGTYVYVCDEGLRGYLGEFVNEKKRLQSLKK
jgi:DUF2075 family protein